MRIAVISNTSWYLVNFRRNLMLALMADGHEVIAVSPEDEYTTHLISSGIRHEAVPLSGSGTQWLTELRSVLCLRRVFQNNRVDVVLSNTPKGNLYSAIACMSLGIRFIPNVSGLGRAFIQTSFVTRIARLLYRLTFRYAHRVFFQNLDDQDIFLRSGLVLPGRYERLPGSGVDVDRFCAAPWVERDTDAPVFLLVARMLWDKGVGEFIDAARLVRGKYPMSTFHLLGAADSDNPASIGRDQIDAWQAEGIVRYLGKTDDVRPHIAHADAVVLPSYREGVPRTLLEAAAMARPVITTDAPGCKDTVIDGQTGLRCKARDAPGLASAMLRFAAMDKASRVGMGERGRARVVREFDEQIVIDRYREALASLQR
ncbi:glycosyltransferase family 4 protein [Sphaerotilus microaerophilus]|jgi:glycosyltransferase involved in cell wall biosynthesis|uniref:Glycosyl transferase n=1 Tax=Sphaerotilus microaerophilus TaxID=2914710 RepID=A0ABN6PKK4_9BURK|nr:glycosyltransferase family 4 protein [Sphaerotilus sp. FB-5]BDI04345.1 glycosyl transferase [Sphaerotilus sp. FB-5]